MAMVMAMAKKQEKNEFWRKQRHKGDCCCFGWAVYAPWACYMNLRTLYVSKLAKCPLICLADLAGDRMPLDLEAEMMLGPRISKHSIIRFDIEAPPPFTSGGRAP